MFPFKNFPQLFEYVAKSYSNPRAFNYKPADKWVAISTAEFCRTVKQLAVALHSLGVKRGEAVGLMAYPSPYWLMVDLAIKSIGAISVPFFPSGSEENLEFKISDSGLRRLFLLSAEAWPRVKPCLRSLDQVIAKDFKVTENKLLDLDALLRKGEALLAQQPALFPSLAAEVRADDLAAIIYTSGSTGTPKGVELTHKNIISQLLGTQQLFPLDAKKDLALTALPLAHSFECMAVYYYIACGVSIYFNSDIKKLGDDLKAVRPTVMVLVPRILEKVYIKIETKIKEASLLEKIIGRWALQLANAHNPETDRRGPVFALANRLVFKKFRQAMGGRFRYVISGGAALKLNLYRFFINIGLPLFQGYGLTEASPVLTANYPGSHKLGTVGKAFPGVTLKLSPAGEVLARGPNLMRGYRHLPKETAEVLDADGWLHSGDLGQIDAAGYLTITGRIKEQFKTSSGKYVSPVPLEQALGASPFIDLAMVIGEGRHFVSALLFPDREAIAKYLKHKNVAISAGQNLWENPLIDAKIKALIEAVNAKLDPWEQIKAYRFIPDAIAVESGELTPTMKLKRHVVLAKYRALIAGIYEER